MKVWKPTIESLQPRIDEAKASRSDWVSLYLDGVKKLIKKDPLRYRTFGPYWWLLKKALIDRGDYAFGDEIDLEWFEALDYGSVELNIAAACAYEDDRTDSQCNIHDDSHMLEDENGEAYEYKTGDSEVDSMARAR